MRLMSALPLCLALAATVACDKKLQASGPASPAPMPQSSAMPLAQASAASAEADEVDAPTVLSGTVVETMSSGGYTYVKLSTRTGEKWAAVTETPVAKGQAFVVGGATEMRGFFSKTLNRTFDVIYFGNPVSGLGGGAHAVPGESAGQKGEAHGSADARGAVAAAHGGASTSSLVALDAPIKKAEGPLGRTVSEVIDRRLALANTTVSVRGKVAKYTANVLGHNWIHLQDGTRSGASFDVTVTTTGTAAVGDVVVARGVVHTDRDFGGGYTYPTIIEDASLEK